MSTFPNCSPGVFSSNFHDFMQLFKKSCTLFGVPNISKHSLIQLWGTVSGFLSMISVTRLVCLLLQFLNIVLSVSRWSFVLRLPFRHLFCSDGSTLSLSRWLYIFSADTPVISSHSKCREGIGL